MDGDTWWSGDGGVWWKLLGGFWRASLSCEGLSCPAPGGNRKWMYGEVWGSHDRERDDTSQAWGRGGKELSESSGLGKTYGVLRGISYHTDTHIHAISIGDGEQIALNRKNCCVSVPLPHSGADRRHQTVYFCILPCLHSFSKHSGSVQTIFESCSM